MGLSDIVFLAILLILIRLIPSRQVRSKFLLVSCCVFVFKFQQVLPVRSLDFLFPLCTLLLTLCVYGAVSTLNPLKSRLNQIDFGIILFTILLICATRFISYDGIVTASRPPQLIQVLPALIIGCAIAILFSIFAARGKKWPVRILVCLILVILIVLKTPRFSLLFSQAARSLNGQSTELALSTDIRWFGFSYIAFRFLSILIDNLNGRKADLNAGDFLTYVCFPPSLSAGPIDRWDRFTKELKAGSKTDFTTDLYAGLGQIFTGLFHKFVLADTLSKMSLSAQNAGQFVHTGWAWAALFCYGLQIYFDFSGYSEIAVGLGILYGIHLPKNFDHPYLKPDITKFWSSWHMTLTQWIRSYVFNPLTRFLRKNKDHPLPQWLIILVTQMTTMILIGLWHGVTLNFIIWGIWHGVGLFIHQLYSRLTGSWLRTKDSRFQQLYTVCTTILSDLYVCLGWIWFVIPDFNGAVSFFRRLFL